MWRWFARPRSRPAGPRWQRALGLALCLALPVATPAWAENTEQLRIVGGLGKLNQYTQHERPFWLKTLPAVTQGRISATIVPFDEAGLRGSELLRLVQVGAVPFATALLPLVAAQDPVLGAPDLAGLNPDMAALRKHMATFRPYMEQRLRERWGIEALAVYVYPAQVTFCAKPFSGLADLSRRRIRSSNAAQSDLIEALGAVPVQTGFADIVPNLRSGEIECAITGTMSGNTIGLHEVTSHVHTMAANWGLAVFGANLAVWNGLAPELRQVLRRELAQLERAIWDDAERETGEGLACNSGTAGCTSGRPGRMVVVPETPADAKRWREIFLSAVLPRWLRRCGEECETVWNQTLGPVTRIKAETTR